MGRFALFAIVAAVAGCAAPKKPTVVRPQVPKPAAIAPVETLPPLSACLYYVDDGTGEVRRISLDGRIREIVLAPGSRNSLSQLQIEAPSRYLVSGLTIGGIPRDGAGYTLLEPFPPQLTRKMLNCIPYVDIGSSETVRAGIGFNDRPSRWKIRRHWGSVQAGDHPGDERWISAIRSGRDCSMSPTSATPSFTIGPMYTSGIWNQMSERASPTPLASQ